MIGRYAVPDGGRRDGQSGSIPRSNDDVWVRERSNQHRVPNVGERKGVADDGRALAVIVVATGAALLGVAVAPRQARAAQYSGWSCYLTDLCHEGTAECCSNNSDVAGGHCSTLCVVKT